MDELNKVEIVNEVTPVAPVINEVKIETNVEKLELIQNDLKAKIDALKVKLDNFNNNFYDTANEKAKAYNAELTNKLIDLQLELAKNEEELIAAGLTPSKTDDIELTVKKYWLKSKTMLFNLTATGLGLFEANVEFIKSHFNINIIAVLVVAVPLINIVLRSITKDSVTNKKD